MHERYPLVLAGNRDEMYERPTAGAAFWPDAAQLFGGRDLVQGGTWLGVTGSGRLAALTNYREPHLPRKDGPSRGWLVSDFLRGESPAGGYVEELRRNGVPYSGYNLVIGDWHLLYCYSNKNDQLIPLEKGIYGLSNHLLDTPWPKVVRGKEALARLLEADDFTAEELFAILADPTRAPDRELPDTGVGLEIERLLSSIFIADELYGTRSSTVLLVDRDRQATFIERSFDGGARRDTIQHFDWSGNRAEEPA